MIRKFIIVISKLVVLLSVGLAGCFPSADPTQSSVILDRHVKIPGEAIKVLPEADINPPQSFSSEYSQPVPVPGLINTAGGEDSAFILPDGKTLYFFFTPVVTLPPQTQVTDGVTGIYESKLVDGNWTEPNRIVLQDKGKLAADGCEFLLGNTIWFCSAREGYAGMNWFKADYVNDTWQDWQLVEFDPSHQVGEFHLSNDMNDLYFGSDRQGGVGNLDIWVSHWEKDHWGEPINLAGINTADAEGWPALNPAGDELWFSRNFGIWRSKLINGDWSEAELMISPLAGEPSVDAYGNVYFTHHFYANDVMLEADIYVAYRH